MNNRRKKMLLVFDGGLVPGYMAAGAGMVEEGEARGYEVWGAAEGFRSLTGDTQLDVRILRLVMSLEDTYDLVLNHGIPAMPMYKISDHPGCDFRSERYKEFVKPELQKKAAEYIKANGFTHVTFLGGNGTLLGAKAILKHLDGVCAGFINCSADSDILGDRSVGFLTALEEGARIARGLFEDALAHKRHYILEMMGNESGKHTLHCGCSARAHIIVLPQMDLSGTVIKDIAETLRSKSHSLTLVAEGYKRKERGQNSPRDSASVMLQKELAAHGLEDRPQKRVIAESYSRFIRGRPPLLMECETAYLKSQLLYKAFEKGEEHVMAYLMGDHDYGTRHLDEVDTDNNVEPVFLDMIDRFQIASLRAHAQAVCNPR